MKIKLALRKEKYEEVKTFFEQKDIDVGEDGDFILFDKENSIEYLIGKTRDELYRIETHEIVYIESIGKTIILHTKDQDYTLSYRLKQLEFMLNQDQFIRISHSIIIAKKSIRKIKPTYSTKFILTLIDGSIVDVTRSYYYMFRETFGI